MVRQRVERKLAAVLIADVAGYSRLMQLDKEETHRRLSVLQREVIRAQIGQYHGKIIKNTGDAPRKTRRRRISPCSAFPT